MRPIRPLTLFGAAGLLAGLVFVFELLPIVVVVAASFGSAAHVQVPPRGLTLAWYGVLFRERALLGPLWLSLGLIAVVVPISVILAAPAAYALKRFAFPFRHVLDGATLAPIMIPEIILAIALLQLASFVGGSQSFALGLLGHTILVFPFVLRTTLAGLASFDLALEEAAIGLGASRFLAFRRIVLPHAWPGLMAGGLLGAIVSFNAFFMSSLLMSRPTLTIMIWDAFRFEFRPSLLALSTMTIIVAAPIIILVERIAGLQVLVGASRS